jgi:hypothetical protein
MILRAPKREWPGEQDQSEVKERPQGVETAEVTRLVAGAEAKF